MRDWSKAKREDLEALAEAVAKSKEPLSHACEKALLTVKQQCPVVRMKRDIDSEIVRILRDSVEEGPIADCLACGDGNADKLRALCKEPWV